MTTAHSDHRPPTTRGPRRERLAPILANPPRPAQPPTQPPTLTQAEALAQMRQHWTQAWAAFAAFSAQVALTLEMQMRVLADVGHQMMRRLETTYRAAGHPYGSTEDDMVAWWHDWLAAEAARERDYRDRWRLWSLVDMEARHRRELPPRWRVERAPLAWFACVRLRATLPAPPLVPPPGVSWGVPPLPKPPTDIG